MLTWSGDREDWLVTMIGREENKQLEPFHFAASMAFLDSRFMSGIACVEQSVSVDLEQSYTFLGHTTTANRRRLWVRVQV